MSGKAVSQYLQRHAEAETGLLADWPDERHYRRVAVIPAYQESGEFIQRALQADWFRADVLLIVVINQPDTQTDSRPQQQLFRQASSSGVIAWQRQHLRLIATPAPNGDMLLVDRFTHPIPARQGVGLARKVGADLALALIAAKVITSEWICSSDADARLPDNYFAALPDHQDAAVAACYAFTHEGGAKEVAEATRIYEQSLHYYVAGLQYAGSSYGFFTIGSTLAFRATAYAQVRGFPPRAAGEDFYLLNKLAKLGRIAFIPQATIRLQARVSARVPFGTGASTARIMQLLQRGEAFRYYHPQTFTELRDVLTHCQQLWEHRAELQRWWTQLPATSAAALQQLGLASFLGKQLPQCRSKTQFETQLQRWFDGLKTLRFIHLLRDACYPDMPLEAAIRQAPFTLSLAPETSATT